MEQKTMGVSGSVGVMVPYSKRSRDDDRLNVRSGVVPLPMVSVEGVDADGEETEALVERPKKKARHDNLLDYNKETEIQIKVTDEVLLKLGRGVSANVIRLDRLLTNDVFNGLGISKKKLSYNQGLNYVGVEYGFESNPGISICVFKMMDRLKELGMIVKSITFNPSGDYIVPVTVTVKNASSRTTSLSDERIMGVCEFEKSIPYRLAVWIENGD